MKKTTVKTINCTQCGSRIKLHGGHRVQMIVCHACNTALDSFEEYKAIQQFRNVKRPALPISIGDIGIIKGVEFVVIGIMRWKEIDDGIYYSFEFQLFSETHGYAWLTRDSDFNYTFMREVKDIPDKVITKSVSIGTKFNARDLNFKVIEKGTEIIDYVEGELTYIAKINDSAHYVTAISPPYIYDVSSSGHEVEYMFGEFISATDVYKAFKIKGAPITSSKRHVCEPPSSFHKSRMNARWFVLISLILAIFVTIKGQGKVIFRDSVSSSSYRNGVTTKDFYVSNPNSLMSINLYCAVDNAWTYFDVSVKKDGHQYFNIGKEISYYHGYSGGESWSEGSRKTKAYFKVPEKGTYQLEVYGEGGSGNYKGTMQNKTLKIIIKKDVHVSRYFWILFIFFLLFGFGPLIMKILEKMSDEDD